MQKKAHTHTRSTASHSVCGSKSFHQTLEIANECNEIFYHSVINYSIVLQVQTAFTSHTPSSDTVKTGDEFNLLAIFSLYFAIDWIMCCCRCHHLLLGGLESWTTITVSVHNNEWKRRFDCHCHCQYQATCIHVLHTTGSDLSIHCVYLLTIIFFSLPSINSNIFRT